MGQNRQLDSGMCACVSLLGRPVSLYRVCTHSAGGIRTASLIDTRSKTQTHCAPASPRRQGAESREPGAGSP